MAGGSFNCLAYSVAFFSCFFVTCILAEAKSITINVVKGITNNDAYVVSLGTGETITVKLKRSVAGEQAVSLRPYDLEKGPYPVGVYRMCNRKKRVSWQELFPQAATDFQFVKWNNASVSTLTINTPTVPELPNSNAIDYCFDLKDSVSEKAILVVAIAGSHRVAGRGFFSPAVFSTILATVAVLVSSQYSS